MTGLDDAPTRPLLPSHLGDLLVLLLGAAILGGVSQIGDAASSPVFWTAAAAVILLVLLGVLVLRLRRSLARLTSLEEQLTEAKTENRVAVSTAPNDTRLAVAAPGGTLFIGLDIGRTRISYGVLRSDAPGGGRLPLPNELDTLASDEQVVDVTDPHRYERYAAAVAQMAKDRSIDGIGAGLPGQIDPVYGTVTGSPAGFSAGEEFVPILAGHLVEHDSVRRALNLPPDATKERQAELIARRILIDNDVRSATRALVPRFVNELKWRNFACIFVGSGVSAGLVLEGAPFYGSGGTAGEIGHMTLDLTGGAGLGYEPNTCGCGRAGVHWESLVGGAGLAALAEQSDPERAARLDAAFGATNEDSRRTSVQFAQAAALVPVIRGTALVNTTVPPEVVALMEEEDMRQYVVSVLERYVEFFGVGVANLINTLNLDHIALGGGVMDGLAPLDFFRRVWRRTLERYALDTPVHTLHPYSDHRGARVAAGGDEPGWAWQGSALLFLDPSYATFKQLRHQAG